jgi:hypothetical protein
VIKYEITEPKHLVIVTFIKVYIQPRVIYYDTISLKSLFFPKWHLGRVSYNLPFFFVSLFCEAQEQHLLAADPKNTKDTHLPAIIRLLSKESK